MDPETSAAAEELLCVCVRACVPVCLLLNVFAIEMQIFMRRNVFREVDEHFPRFQVCCELPQKTRALLFGRFRLQGRFSSSAGSKSYFRARDA